MSSSITGRDSIHLFRIITLRAALKLEVAGMQRRGRSAYSLVKDEFGFRGNKQRVLEQIDALIKQREAAEKVREAETQKAIKGRNMKTFNHMMDVAFTIINGDSDPDKLTEAALIEGMERRLRDLKKMPPGEALEAFGHCDTYEMDNLGLVIIDEGGAK